MTTPAGWYPDANGQQRYWDGNAWTEHVAPGAPQPDPATAQPAPPAPAPGYGQAAPGYGQPVPGYAAGWPPTAYLEGAGSDFGGAIRDAFGNIFEWNGRASRSSFWWYELGVFIVAFIVYALLLAIRLPALIFVLDVVLFLAGLALAIRRLHDTDRSGWWLLIGFFPLFGGIVLLVFFVLEGTRGPNKYNINLAGQPAT